MRKVSLRSTDVQTTVIEKSELYDIYDDFKISSEEIVQEGKPYTFLQQNLIENFIEENHYISIFPLLHSFNSVNTYPNKKIIELLLNTCLNDEDEEIISESCNIVQHISSIPKVFNYQEYDKIININKELPFEFLANDEEQLYIENIIVIMMNSLGNIEGYEKLNKDDEPNEVMEQINKELFNIVNYKETRKIEKPETMYFFFHTIVIILKNDILQNQNLMKKTLLYRIIKKMSLNKLILKLCELFDYTTYYNYEQISFIQSDIQLFIYLISLFSYTKPVSLNEDDNKYLINREMLIDKIKEGISNKMLFPFIETIVDIKIKQGLIERMLHNKCDYEGRRNVPLHTKLDEDKVLGYCLNFNTRDRSCKGNLEVIHLLLLLVQSFLLNHPLTDKHKSEWFNVLVDMKNIANSYSSINSTDQNEINNEKELSYYYNLFEILVLNYF